MGVEPNEVTYVFILLACVDLESLGFGKEVHEDIVRRGGELVVVVYNSLIDMYTKFRSMDEQRIHLINVIILHSSKIKNNEWEQSMDE